MRRSSWIELRFGNRLTNILVGRANQLCGADEESVCSLVPVSSFPNLVVGRLLFFVCRGLTPTGGHTAKPRIEESIATWNILLSLTGRIEQRTGTHAGLRRQASQVPITLVGTLPSSEESGRPNRLELERDTPRDANPAFIERAAVSGAMHTPAKSKIMVTTSPCDVLPHWNATLTVPQSFKTRLHTKIVTAPQRHRRLRLG